MNLAGSIALAHAHMKICMLPIASTLHQHWLNEVFMNANPEIVRSQRQLLCGNF